MTVKGMLDEVRSHLGYHEGPNNYNIFGREYGMNNEPWCDIFLSVCAKHVGELSAVNRESYCPSDVAHFRSIGRYTTDFNNIERGYKIFWSWPRDNIAYHVEIVESVNVDSKGTVTSVVVIGGNTGPNSDQVYRQTRSGYYFLGAGKPAYSNVNTAWPGKLLVLGSHNDAVHRMQSKLKITADGSFGPKTLSAVKAFQSAHHLSVDGQAGMNTWGALFGNG